MATVDSRHRDVKVLYDVPFRMYVRLVRNDANRHLRMAYNDGVLQIVSPHLLRHELPSGRLRIIVTTVCETLGIGYQGAGSTTFRKSGVDPFKGRGKEADQSFYLSSLRRLRLDRDPDLDAGDLPPDLWIEADNRIPAQDRLDILAGLGVPEVWIYRTRRKRLRFLGLVGDHYELLTESRELPTLTPALVLKALALGENLAESDWVRGLRAWAARNFAPRAADA